MTLVRYNRKRDHIRITMTLAEALEVVSDLQPIWQFKQELNRLVTFAGSKRLAGVCTAAKVQARMRGHKLGEWAKVGDHIRDNICLNCGQSVRVNSQPTTNEIDIGGEAVALDCPGKPSRKRKNGPKQVEWQELRSRGASHSVNAAPPSPQSS